MDLFRIDENLEMKRELANLQTDKIWKNFCLDPPILHPQQKPAQLKDEKDL